MQSFAARSLSLPALSVAVWTLAVACGDATVVPDAGDPGPSTGDPNGSYGDTANPGDVTSPGDSTLPPPSCYATVCLAGAIKRNDGANPFRFEPLCAAAPGIIQDPAALQHSIFEFSDTHGAVTALVDALDTNESGYVDGADEACIVSMIGYSWGGVNAAELLAEAFVGHLNVALARSVVDRLVAIDPYSPLTGDTVEIPYGVTRYWSYRHTVSPLGDCSEGAPLGPYEGLPPLCYASTDCVDYDYSSSPLDYFNGLRGDEIDHCTIVDVARPAVLHNITTGTDFNEVPATHPVGSR